MSLNEKLIKEYNEVGDVKFYHSIRKRASKMRKSVGSNYKHFTVYEDGTHSIIQFYNKELRLISGNNETHYFNREEL